MPTPATACSPCSHLARDTEVGRDAAVPPDSRAASFLCETPQLILLSPPILIVLFFCSILFVLFNICSIEGLQLQFHLYNHVLQNDN